MVKEKVEIKIGRKTKKELDAVEKELCGKGYDYVIKNLIKCRNTLGVVQTTVNTLLVGVLYNPWCQKCGHRMIEKKRYLVCPKCGYKREITNVNITIHESERNVMMIERITKRDI
ncbi:MAG: hypothetical protein KJ886_03510 [Candidatus Thermoplasmatota archaeon]|nr:hypothetical protein [Candidatus Thermoplasmatota archaeon]MBU4256492.1 hypothetical protein [Candidatus Thermoplasmatota archaeon]MCG2826470.1 hypothetical protein [Thermoplasmatales archaeon]